MPDTATLQSVTHKFSVHQTECYLTLAVDDDGRLALLDVKVAKWGSTMAGLITALCRVVNLALDQGASARDIADRFRGLAFEPRGQTTNPDIAEAQSICDYIARYIDARMEADQ